MNENIDKTKLAGILKSFDKKDRLAAKKFLASPYFNSSKELGQLFVEINKLIDKNKTLSKAYLWKKLMKSATYNDTRFRKFCSDLSKLMEQFLAQKAFDQQPIQQKIFLLKSLNEGEKKAEKLAASTIRIAEDMMEQHPYRDTSYYLHQYQLQKHFHELFDYDTKRGLVSNIELISDNLDLFYIGEKLRLITEAESRKKLKSYQYKLKMTNEILALTQDKFEDLKVSPQIEIYYQIYKILSEENADDNYYQLKDLIVKNAAYFPREVAIEELYGAAQNYCVKKINTGNRQFLNELFDLFQMLINQKLIVTDNVISPWYFRNIVFVGLRLGKYDWVEDFIHSYKDYLPTELKENAVTFNLAQLYFYQKRYEQVIEQLRYVEYDDLSYNLNSKTILMATYYELDEIEPLYSLTDTFRAYLSRQKKLPQSKINDYLNLIRFIRRLIKIIPGDNKTLEKLREDVQATKGTVNANWLLEKISELEK